MTYSTVFAESLPSGLILPLTKVSTIFDPNLPQNNPLVQNQNQLRALLRNIIPSILPLEDFRASGFLLQMDSTTLVITAGHVVRDLVLESSQKNSKTAGYSLEKAVSKNSIFNFQYIAKDHNELYVSDKIRGSAKLLYVPQNFKKELEQKLIIPPSSDFAISLLLKDALSLKPLKVGAEPKAGESVILIGFPGMSSEVRKLGMSIGVVLDNQKSMKATREAFRDEKFQFKPEVEFITLAEAIPGSSGGLAVNMKGEVVGIIESGLVPTKYNIIQALNAGKLKTRVVKIQYALKEFQKQIQDLSPELKTKLAKTIKSRSCEYLLQF